MSTQRIGDYEILRELGRGGMGSVYKVRNVISDRIEAMKVLLPELASREELVARFLREIKLVASLEHPNIAALRTALQLEGQIVMIMEFVEGTSLADRLDQGPIPFADALQYTDQVLRALSYAHQRGVVHRDIKPSNMMLTPDGTVKVMDFGIAFSGTEHKLTATGTTLGSLAYMSPEQVKGEQADPRSDLYSLGVSLYEMVTGQRPFKADSDFAIMSAHVKEAPRPPMELQPGLPPALNAVIMQALAKEKEQRFQSAEAFRNALASVPTTGMAEESPPVAAPAGDRTFVFTPATPVPAARPSATSPSQPSAAAMGAAPAQVPPPPIAPAGSHRGLYMALGAVLMIVLLVAAGSYYKSGAARSAAQQVQPAAHEQKQPEAGPAPSTPAAAEATPAQPAPDSSAATPDASNEPAAAPAEKPKASAADARPFAPAKPAPNAAPAQEAAKEAAARKAAEAEQAAQLEELEDQIDKLTSRALAVDTSLETLRRQQRAAGYDLRADMAARQESMKINLQKAREALEKKDYTRGKKYADLAEGALGALEKFIGR
jgi:serine/threonine-protein kinase